MPPDYTEAGEILETLILPELPLTMPLSYDDINDWVEGRILARLSLFVSIITS
jgi:hypothetical protein